MRDTDALAKTTTQQLISGNVQGLADNVIEGRIDSGFTIRVTLDGFVHHRMNRFKPPRILVRQSRCENIVDNVNRALRRLAKIFAMISAPILQYRRFTESDQTLVGM